MYYLRQLTILHYITELFVSHSTIGLAIHVNNLLYLITWQMRLSTTAKAQAANKLQGNKTKQSTLTLNNSEKTAAATRTFLRNLIYSDDSSESSQRKFMNSSTPRLQSRSHWQGWNRFLTVEFWGTVSKFKKRTDKSSFVCLRSPQKWGLSNNEYDCKCAGIENVTDD